MKNFNPIFLLIICVLFHSCKSTTEESDDPEIIGLRQTEQVQVQGHRGDRGNFPENSIPAFISAVKKGVDVLELDLVISKDNRVVVSHEPYMSSLFVSTPTGDSITKDNEYSYNIYEMTYDSIKMFDVGSRGNERFPEQKKMKTYKPLLSEVIDTVEAFIAAEGLKPVTYNIEIKSVEEEYGKYQPQPEVFVDLVMEVIKNQGVEEKINIQSFDPKILNIMNGKYPGTPLAYLVSNEGIEKNLSLITFTPEIYSPDFKLVNPSFVDSVKSKKMQLIPWTVNEKKDIRKMIDLQVDGIITDYPERVIEIKKKTS